MSFIEKAIIDIQENVSWIQYDVGGFFDGSIVNNSSTDVLKVRLKYPSRQLDIVVKPGFMLQMSDIFLDLILCSGSYSICGLVKSKAQKLPVLNFAGVGIGRNYVLNVSGVAVNPSTEDTLNSLNGKVQTQIDTLNSLNGKAQTQIDTLNSLNSKIQSQTANLFVKDVSVGTTAVQIDTDTAYRDEVILLADKNNTADIKVGTSTSQSFPLSPGASVGVRKTSLNLIYAVAVSGTQTLHVIAGGS
jgi:hypothetical protein